MRELIHLLPKPSHYAGSEDGAVIKNPEETSLHIALAFPDVYEVGMSYLGQKILYGIVNDRPGWWAERVMAPEAEACAVLRENNAPLCTLESDTPLRDLAAVCFSVTHELCCTDILNMLDLAHIPLRAADRPVDITECPVIMAGGGAMLGAEPLSPFFDLVALGDGEDLLPEILELLEQARAEGWSRCSFLEKARHIRGVYVPAFFQEREDGSLAPVYADYRPVRRIVTDLNQAYFPERQVGPVGAVHNRLSLEIGRGCTRGCRFCHAGMIYRPVRERAPEEVSRLLDGCLTRTGFDEVSFLALSAGDCTALKTLYEGAYDRCQKEQTTLCLPSLRVGSVDDGIMAKMAELRRPGVTLAPEAGSQRLRDVINKGITEADLLLHLQKLLEHGWRQVKLYFMIGLPTETDEDLEAIVNLCARARDAGGRGAPRFQVTAAISPFVPKPFTPFQWEAQASLSEIERRINFLRSRLAGQKGIRLKWHEPASSYLEGILSRGDRKLADVVEKAFRKGAIFCGWNEHFDLAPWLEALEECNLDPAGYTGARSGRLPWEHIEAGANREFLWRERERAYRGQTTTDCRYGSCAGCGACGKNGAPSLLGENTGHLLVFDKRDQTENRANLDETGRLILRQTAQTRPRLDPALIRRAGYYRVWHVKKHGAAFLSQLELQSVLQRALRRSRVPVAFSQGFHPLPLLSFGRALPVGVESEAEWFGLVLHSLLAPAALTGLLNPFLPEGLALTSVEAGAKKAAQAISETFSLEFASENDLLSASAAFSDFCARQDFILTRQTRKGEKTEDIRPLLASWKVSLAGGKSGLVFVADWSDSYLSPMLLAKAILEPAGIGVRRIVKLKQTFADGSQYGAG